MKDFAKRAIGSCVSIAIVSGLLVFALHPRFQLVVAGVIALLACVAIWEYEQLAKAKGGRMTLPVLIAIGAAQVFSFYVQGNTGGGGFFPLLVFFIGFLVLIALHFRDKDGAILNLAVSSFGLLYIAVPMGMMLAILYGVHGQDGRWWVAYLLIVTKISDIGAYFGGSFWGRRKLAPKISPGKTTEGAIVGLVCTVTASYVFASFLSSSEGVFHLDPIRSLWLGVILGCIGQFGDLAESLLKRDASKKDSNTLPGLGGVLDLIDSLLFNTFIVYFYLNYLQP